MKQKIMWLAAGSFVFSTLLVCFAADGKKVILLAFDEQKPESPDSANTEETADGRAIDLLKQNFTEAFAQADSARVAALLTKGAELIPDDAPPLHGRQNIETALAQHFADAANKAKIELDPDGRRFISRDAAIEEGHVKITKGHAAPTVQRYSLLVIREDGEWLLASIKEWPSKEAGLRELGWLIGTWHAKQDNVEAKTTYEWFGDKAFIKGVINLSIDGHAQSAVQVIGKDPRTDELRIWTFEVGGGIIEGTCTRDGEAWLFQTEGVSADGSAISNKNILARVNDDVFTWQPVDITVDGEQRTNLPPVKMTRVKSAE